MIICTITPALLNVKSYVISLQASLLERNLISLAKKNGHMTLIPILITITNKPTKINYPINAYQTSETRFPSRTKKVAVMPLLEFYHHNSYLIAEALTELDL